MAVYRDLFILVVTKPFFRTRIFHFHAGGLSEIYQTLNPIARWLFRIAYYDPAVAIRTSPLAPEDPKAIHARMEVVVPNGIVDHFDPTAPVMKQSPPSILFVGLVSRSKGAEILLDACRLLVEKRVEFQMNFVGAIESAEFRDVLEKAILRHNLSGVVHLMGTLAGDAKYDLYARSTIFCNPTFFESETFSLVVLEAMQFSLPVVATRWRGIPSLVEDGYNGYLVDPRNSELLATKLELLIRTPALAVEMGLRGRAKYCADYTLERFHDGIEEAVCAALAQGLPNAH